MGHVHGMHLRRLLRGCPLVTMMFLGWTTLRSKRCGRHRWSHGGSKGTGPREYLQDAHASVCEQYLARQRALIAAYRVMRAVSSWTYDILCCCVCAHTDATAQPFTQQTQPTLQTDSMTDATPSKRHWSSEHTLAPVESSVALLQEAGQAQALTASRLRALSWS